MCQCARHPATNRAANSRHQDGRPLSTCSSPCITPPSPRWHAASGAILPFHVFPRHLCQATPASSPRSSARTLRVAAARPDHTAGRVLQAPWQATTLKQVHGRAHKPACLFLIAPWPASASAPAPAQARGVLEPQAGPKGASRCLGHCGSFHAGTWTSSRRWLSRPRALTGQSDSLPE